MTEQNERQGFLESLRPKTAFVVGVGVAIFASFVVGFFLMLWLTFAGDGTAFSRNVTTVTETATAVTQPTTTKDIQLAPVTDSDWIRGDKKAKISIVEFSDTECPFCKQFHPVMQRIVEEYDGKVNWVYRHFPIASLHSRAAKEFEATECAGELGGNDGFWDYLDRIFEITPSNDGLDPAQLPKIASYVGLDEAAFTACLDSGKYNAKVQQSVNAAVAAGAQGTPYSVIVAGEEFIPLNGALPYEQVKATLDAIL